MLLFAFEIFAVKQIAYHFMIGKPCSFSIFLSNVFIYYFVLLSFIFVTVTIDLFEDYVVFSLYEALKDGYHKASFYYTPSTFIF